MAEQMRPPSAERRLFAAVDMDKFDRDVRDQIQNGPRLAAGYGDDMNPLAALQGRESENGPLVGRVFVIRSNYFDPTKDSLLFDAQSGGGNLLRRDTMSDGRTRDVFADGYQDTDADGKSTFTRADTSLDFVSAKSYDDVVSRFKYLNHKYDPESLGDRFLNLFTKAMDDPDRVLSNTERTERDLLDHRMYVARDQAQNPEKYSPSLQHWDNIRSSVLSNGIYQAARFAGADEQKQRDLARLGKAASDVAFARSTAVNGGPAYTGAKGAPDLSPNGGIPANGARRIVPLGFERGSQFSQAAAELQSALKASGIDDAVVGVRASSVIGGSPRKGTRFGPQSDVDFFVESAQLTSPFKESPNIPGFVHPGKILRKYPLLQDWSTNWSNNLGRKVSPGGFVPGTVPDQPVIIVR